MDILEKEEFRRFLRGNKKLAITTSKVLVGCLPKTCFEWTQSEGKDFYFDQMDREDLSSGFKNSLHYAVKYFFEWKEWAFEYKKPRVHRARRKPVELEDIWKLLEVITDKRDLALILTHLYTGLRPSELLNLKIEDIDFMKGMLTIKNTKTYRNRQVPINKKPLLAIRRYLATRRDNNSFVFYSKLEDKKLGCSGYRHVLEKYCIAAKIPIICSYRIRHTFATEWIAQNNGNLLVLKDILGHSDIKQTEQYCQNNPTIIKASYDRACPEF